MLSRSFVYFLVGYYLDEGVHSLQKTEAALVQASLERKLVSTAIRNVLDRTPWNSFRYLQAWSAQREGGLTCYSPIFIIQPGSDPLFNSVIPECFLKWFTAQNSIFVPGKLVINAVLLVYSALVIPFQLSFWVEDDVCNPSPTLYCDVFVDTIFLVNMIEIMIRGFVYTSGCNNCLF